MAFNSNYDILEPAAWNALLLSNDFPMRPALANANTNIAGVNIEGQVAQKNKTVKIPKAVKPTDDAKVYSGGGSYTADTNDFSQPELKMETVYYRNFFVDKWDEMFALPDLIQAHVLPKMHNILDSINANFVKRELNKFHTAVADQNTGTTVLDTTDVRFVRKELLKRHFVEDKLMAAVLNPDGEFDLTGLGLFQQADQRGDRDVQLSGSMGQAFGFEYLVDNVGSDIDSTSAVGDAVVAASASIGDTTVTIDDGAGGGATETMAKGDILFFGTADDRNQYYTVESVNDAGTEITLNEPLRDALSDNDAITGVSGSAQYFYDPESIAVITAIPSASQVRDASGTVRIPFFEPQNRVNFLISLEGKTAGVDVTIETLVGAKNFYETRGGIYVRGEQPKA